MIDDKGVVTVIFSKNRAMQLDLCLNTLMMRCFDVRESDICVIYKADVQHKESYETLKREYDYVRFIEEKNFKNDLLSVISDRSLVLFVVDDTIFTDCFSLRDISLTLLCEKNCAGFSLRLGNNTNWCYPFNCSQNIPEITYVNSLPIYGQYCWTNAHLDFSYPLEVSSSLYRVKDLLPFLQACQYANPNALEAIMLSNIGRFSQSKPNLLCFERSVAFSNPINKVQQYNNNRSENISSDYLLQEFQNGKRIDDIPFQHYKSNGAHQYVPISFVEKRQ